MNNATNNGGEIERLLKGLRGYEVAWDMFWRIHPDAPAEHGHAWALDGFLRDSAELKAARIAAGKVATAEPGIAPFADGRRETVIEREVRLASEERMREHRAFLAEIRAGRVTVPAE